MSKYSIKNAKRVDSGMVLNRSFDVYYNDRRLFRVEAYSGNCCGASTIECVNGYTLDKELAGAIKFLASLTSGQREQIPAPWRLQSFFFFGSDQEEYKRVAKTFGMKEVFRFPSRSEPGHDVVQYFVDLGKDEPIPE